VAGDSSMRRSVLHLPICGALLFLTALSRTSGAHNGAVAIAVPMEEIVSDGDLSAWPAQMRRALQADVTQCPACGGHIR